MAFDHSSLRWLGISGLIAEPEGPPFISHTVARWRPGRVRGYRLRFNLEGPPRGKATYANLCADPAAEVWGVLYKITRRDLVRLEATEGVPWWRYRPLWLDAEDMSGTALHAATLTAEGDEDDYTPTLRYLTLLREGARAHGLPDHYIRFLEQVEHG